MCIYTIKNAPQPTKGGFRVFIVSEFHSLKNQYAFVNSPIIACVMETYGKILLIAMPSFLVLVLFEKWWGWRKGNDTVRSNDMISSLSSGITNAVKDVLGLSVAIISYQWLTGKVAIAHVDSGWLTYAV